MPNATPEQTNSPSSSQNSMAGKLGKTLGWIWALCGVALAWLILGFLERSSQPGPKDATVFSGFLIAIPCLGILWIAVLAWRLRSIAFRIHEDLDRSCSSKNRAIADLQGSVKILSEVSSRLSRSIQKDQILANVREALIGLIPCEGAFLFIKDYESDRYKLTGSISGKSSLINSAMLSETSYEEDFAPIKEAIAQRKSIIVEDVTKSGHFLKPDTLGGLRSPSGLSLACIPLSVEDEVLGMAFYYVDGERMKKIHWEDMTWMAVMRQISVALGSAVQNELAVHDRLTKLYNHGYFHEALAKAFGEARMHLASGPRQGCLSLIMVDIDHFKSFNDTYGHQTGDAVLRQIASAIRRQCHPSYDTPARYGGEEFAVILRMTPLSLAQDVGQDLSGSNLAQVGGALARAETLRRTIERMEFSGADSPLKVTISVGVGTWRYPDDDAVDKVSFVKAVDDQLYRAKKSGRNRVCF